jgi:hypothetical protein
VLGFDRALRPRHSNRRQIPHRKLLPAAYQANQEEQPQHNADGGCVVVPRAQGEDGAGKERKQVDVVDEHFNGSR